MERLRILPSYAKRLDPRKKRLRKTMLIEKFLFAIIVNYALFIEFYEQPSICVNISPNLNPLLSKSRHILQIPCSPYQPNKTLQNHKKVFFKLCRNFQLIVGRVLSFWEEKMKHLPPIIIQILAIILIMLLSLSVLGYNVLKIINTMKITTNQEMAKNNNLLEHVNNSRKRLNGIQTLYALALIGKSNMPSENTLQGAIDMLSILKTADEERVTPLVDKLESFRRYLKINPSAEGFTRLRSISMETSAVLDRIQRKTGESSNMLIINNERYSRRAKNLIIAIIIISAFVSTLLSFLIAVSISRSLKMIGSSTKALASGDLTQKVQTSSCPEIQAVAIELNNAINELKRLVSVIHKQSKEINQTSRTLHTTSAQTKLSSSQVATAMEELAKSTVEQVGQVERAINTVQNLINLVERVNNEI